MTMTRNEAVALAIVIGTGVVLLSRGSRPLASKYPYSDFIDPAAVADIAASLPADEDEFIIAAWDLVGREIQYAEFGTILYLTPDGIECEPCLLPRAVLDAGASNCVGKAELLTSILRNRLPPERVYMAVGTLKLNRQGGHAWVRCEKNGIWYALESTLPPPQYPWIPEASVAYKYEPDGFLNDQEFYCVKPELCLAIQHTSCLPYVADEGYGCLFEHHEGFSCI